MPETIPLLSERAYHAIDVDPDMSTCSVCYFSVVYYLTAAGVLINSFLLGLLFAFDSTRLSTFHCALLLSLLMYKTFAGNNSVHTLIIYGFITMGLIVAGGIYQAQVIKK